MPRIVTVRPNATRYLNMTTDNRAVIYVEKKIHNKAVRVIPGEKNILGEGERVVGIESIGQP